jgi:hypothetical protein
MLFDNFIQVCGLYKAIPDLFRINDNGRTVLALLQAPGFVDPQNARQSGSLDFVSEQFVELTFAVRAARWASGACLALIGANENVAIKWWQRCS